MLQINSQEKFIYSINGKIPFEYDYLQLAIEVIDTAKKTKLKVEDNLISSGYDSTGNNNNAHCKSYDFHGTCVSSIVSAVGNNETGGVGAACGAKLFPIRCFYHTHEGGSFKTKTSWFQNAILYASNNGADVLNMSWGMKKSQS